MFTDRVVSKQLGELNSQCRKRSYGSAASSVFGSGSLESLVMPNAEEEPVRVWLLVSWDSQLDNRAVKTLTALFGGAA